MTADEIRALREHLGLDREFFAQALGVSSATVERWERGEERPEERLLQALEALVRGDKE